ncbi:MAG: peptide deformylase [Desulfobacterales bacterium]|nr:peptide deformylase [Desulfobacterales bacterium]
MAVLKIVTYPTKSLSEPSARVEEIDEELRQLIDDMGETMFAESGVGLAAPQVGVNKRLFVYDTHAADPEYDGDEQSFTVLINPEIIEKRGSFVSENEGCLSVVEYRADVKRAESVTVRAMDIDGNEMEFDADGLLAVIMQHESDHLDGVLFIDRISSLKRAMYKKRLKKQMKEKK